MDTSQQNSDRRYNNMVNNNNSSNNNNQVDKNVSEKRYLQENENALKQSRESAYNSNMNTGRNVNSSNNYSVKEMDLKIQNQELKSVLEAQKEVII